MNTETNELFLMTDEQRKAYEEMLNPAVVEVPEHLSRAARRALGKATKVTISKTSGGKLSRWAAQQRKARRKAAKQARKRNR